MVEAEFTPQDRHIVTLFQFRAFRSEMKDQESKGVWEYPQKSGPSVRKRAHRWVQKRSNHRNRLMDGEKKQESRTGGLCKVTK